MQEGPRAAGPGVEGCGAKPQGVAAAGRPSGPEVGLQQLPRPPHRGQISVPSAESGCARAADHPGRLPPIEPTHAMILISSHNIFPGFTRSSDSSSADPTRPATSPHPDHPHHGRSHSPCPRPPPPTTPPCRRSCGNGAPPSAPASPASPPRRPGPSRTAPGLGPERNRPAAGPYAGHVRPVSIAVAELGTALGRVPDPRRHPAEVRRAGVDETLAARPAPDAAEPAAPRLRFLSVPGLSQQAVDGVGGASRTSTTPIGPCSPTTGSSPRFFPGGRPPADSMRSMLLDPEAREVVLGGSTHTSAPVVMPQLRHAIELHPPGSAGAGTPRGRRSPSIPVAGALHFMASAARIACPDGTERLADRSRALRPSSVDDVRRTADGVTQHHVMLLLFTAGDSLAEPQPT